MENDDDDELTARVHFPVTATYDYGFSQCPRLAN
jgi:hypothetical protein